MKKPANLVYGVEEKPPTPVMLVSAVQHVGVIAIFMIYPLIIARQAGIDAAEVSNILRLGMLALAIAAILQALPKGPVGSRFLAPSIFTGVYLGPSLLAVKVGGLPLVWGMTMFAGIVEIVLSRFWIRLRTFIPPESAGLVVFLIGLIIGLAALRLLIGGSSTGEVAGGDGAITAVTLAVMVGFNIWNKGKLRLFCILIGMVVGYVASAIVGLLTARDFALVLQQPLFALPSFGHLSYAFDASLAVPFAVSGLAAAMSVTAVVTTYQRTSDADWVRPDMVSISRGILGDGIAATVAGLFGTFGLTVSTANVGLTAATGVASRNISWIIAAILVLAAFQPTLIGILAIMPPPVMAASLLFTAVFIMIGGVQIISSRILDQRRTLVVGMGMMAFVVVSVFPAAFAAAPAWAQPLVTSPLVLATLVALFLNLVFRLGIRRTVTLEIPPKAADFQAISAFIERNGGVWGARRDVITRVQFAAQQATEAVVDFCRPAGPIQLAVSYDEFDIDARLSYAGMPFALAERAPSQEEMLASDDGGRQLAGYLIRHYADKVQVRTDNGKVVVELNFRQ
ncbi:MAG TPA: solute carrier family 23 protein [Stellaceae bacterium]|nr:solute carrier family 23 protein [Stellaceae bacterium]